MNLEQYEIEREARRPVYQKLIDILIADPLGWEMMCSKVRGGDALSLSSAVTQPPKPPEKDELFDRAKETIAKHYKRGEVINAKNFAMTFGCSYGRASSLIDQIEAHGIISPKDGAKPRKVL